MNRVKILKDECQELISFLEKLEDKKNINKKEWGILTRLVGKVFYGLCLFIKDGEITEENIEKAASTEQKKISRLYE